MEEEMREGLLRTMPEEKPDKSEDLSKKILIEKTALLANVKLHGKDNAKPDKRADLSRKILKEKTVLPANVKLQQKYNAKSRNEAPAGRHPVNAAKPGYSRRKYYGTLQHKRIVAARDPLQGFVGGSASPEGISADHEGSESPLGLDINATLS